MKNARTLKQFSKTILDLLYISSHIDGSLSESMKLVIAKIRIHYEYCIQMNTTREALFCVCVCLCVCLFVCLFVFFFDTEILKVTPVILKNRNDNFFQFLYTHW